LAAAAHRCSWAWEPEKGRNPEGIKKLRDKLYKMTSGKRNLPANTATQDVLQKQYLVQEQRTCPKMWAG
jgi:hypothetical protein